MKRVFLIVLDSFGVGEMPDSHEYGDVNVNTLRSVLTSKYYNAPNLEKIGLLNLIGEKKNAIGAYGKMAEMSKGKDTTIGHWELGGVISNKPLPTYPNGFPQKIIKEYELKTGRKVLCNLPYSGTEVIKDYGEEQIKTGGLIVYTSADSVFQVAAHIDVVPLEELYKDCQIARDMLQGEHAVGRVIARPFAGEYPFYRTADRHDYSLDPPGETILDVLYKNKYDTIAVGKIKDIFNGNGITKSYKMDGNHNGMEITINIAKEEFNGLCFVNLVDFDMKYGHRRDIDGYAKAISDFDIQLGELIKLLKEDDIVILTADHGCDPAYTKSTDHTREYVPILCYGKHIKQNVDLGTRKSFADCGRTIADYFGLTLNTGESFLEGIING